MDVKGDRLDQSESDYENDLLNQADLEQPLKDGDADEEDEANDFKKQQLLEEDEALELDVFDQAREMELDIQTHEQPQIHDQIAELEDQLLQQKSWQMKGEVQAH